MPLRQKTLNDSSMPISIDEENDLNSSTYDFQSEFSMDPDMMNQMNNEEDGDGVFIPKQPVIDHLEKIKKKN
jgi:hypothetical protein